MATALKHMVVRKCENSFGHTKKGLIVILEPGDLLGIREQGRKTTYRAPLEKIYWVMAKWHAAEAVREKSKEKKLRKAFRESITG